MIVRDDLGIICQHSKDDVTYLDGGDSCSRTGIMALQHTEDYNKLGYFVAEDHRVVRHPDQPKWNDPAETSRDNIICFFVSKPTLLLDSTMLYASSWFVNKDFLDPAVRLYLYKCAEVRAPLWLRLLGYPWMALALIWNCYIRPDEEQNQFACVCIVYGKPWAKTLLSWHPDVNKNILDYWSGWRDQPEIGAALILTLAERGLDHE